MRFEEGEIGRVKGTERDAQPHVKSKINDAITSFPLRRFVRNVRHSSRIELSQAALAKNINFLKKKLVSHPRYSAVVKANAYVPRYSHKW